ncbi:hypothetical protein EG834_20560 [bacterium]|nr:hypothetical protein [bacterium]
MRARIILKAIGLGLLTEIAASAASLGCILVGGWGTCGPASYWSAAGALLQFPGWHLELEVLRWGMHPGVPGYSWDLPIIFSMQVLLWSTAWLLWLMWQARRRRPRR